MRVAFAALALLAFPADASAQALLLGPPLDEQAALPREDGVPARLDAWREVLFDDDTPFPYGVVFLGEPHDRAYINLDGSMSFGAWIGQSLRSHQPFAETDDPLSAVLAPFSARVADAAAAACDADPHAHRIFLEADRDWLLVTWNAMLRPGDRCGAGVPTNTVQLVILPTVPNEETLEACNRPPRAPDPCFTIEYRYPALGWAEYCIDPALGCGDRQRAGARVGIDAAGNDFELAVPRSGSPAVAHLGARSNADETGVWRFEVIAGELLPDRDADGRTDDADNCPDTPNPGQSNVDGDPWGDACDDDSDGDRVLNCSLGECPGDVDGGDNDLDGEADEFGECIYSRCYPEDDRIDNDDDGRVDEANERSARRHRATDNCPLKPNASQRNRDGDEYGDACDHDADGDGQLDWISALLARIAAILDWIRRLLGGLA